MLHFLLFTLTVGRSSSTSQINNMSRPKCSTVIIVTMVTFLQTTTVALVNLSYVVTNLAQLNMDKLNMCFS